MSIIYGADPLPLEMWHVGADPPPLGACDPEHPPDEGGGCHPPPPAGRGWGGGRLGVWVDVCGGELDGEWGFWGWGSGRGRLWVGREGRLARIRILRQRKRWGGDGMGWDGDEMGWGREE